MRYFRPRSLTWWAGAGLVGLGALALLRPEIEALPGILALAAALTGSADASPVGLIAMGLGLIGLRDAIARMPR